MDFISKQFEFSPGERCVIIAEIGVNHNNNEQTLFKLIDEGVAAGVDIIKLQRFKADEEISITAPSAEYQKDAGVGDNQLAMAKKLELSDELLIKAFNYCKEKQVGFLCTAFDHGSVDFIADTLGCTSIKVPSPDITNKPLIQHMANKFNALLVSTGASTLAEVERALDWVKEVGDREIALMHCTSQYPAPINQANLKAIKTMKTAFNLPVGYSDHTEGITAGIVAATLGASMLEKHYTLDKGMPGPDHKASADINELTQLVNSLADTHSCIGAGIKKPVKAELNNLLLIRKSITCSLNELSAGTVIQRNMLGIKRPMIKGAVEPYDMEKIIGLKLKKDKRFDEAILWNDFQ